MSLASFPAGSAARLGGHDLPENRVVGVAARVVDHALADLGRHLRDVGQQVVHRHRKELRVACQQLVGVGDVALVMLVVMDLHRRRVDVGLQRVVGVRQLGQRVADRLVRGQDVQRGQGQRDRAAPAACKISRRVGCVMDALLVGVVRPARRLVHRARGDTYHSRGLWSILCARKSRQPVLLRIVAMGYDPLRGGLACLTGAAPFHPLPGRRKTEPGGRSTSLHQDIQPDLLSCFTTPSRRTREIIS